MSERFELGEVAIFNCPTCYLHGEECVVIGGLEYRDAVYMGTQVRWAGMAYRVECRGACYVAEPCELRKKRPPASLGSWDRIQEITRWNPTKVTA